MRTSRPTRRSVGWLSLCTVGVPVAVGPFAAHARGIDLPLRTTSVVGGLNFPIGVAFAPGDAAHMYIVEKPGRIRVYDIASGALLAEPFLDIDALVEGGTVAVDERGLLGLAFDPAFQRNGYLYVNYTGTLGGGDTFVQRFKAGSALAADPGSALTITTFDQPFSNHNGGWMGFGPDGYLYVATGDGGSGGDPFGAAQDLVDQPLGKILRLDVSGDDFPDDIDRNYRIPPDNPFVGIEGDDEIWAYGLRNPWRCSFDRQNGDLWIADVGQATQEEIDVAPAGIGGLNFGWRCKEGTVCVGWRDCPCTGPDLVEPVHSYGHNAQGGLCVIGGFMYRGCAIPEAQGSYFFVDYAANRYWSMAYVDGAARDVTVQTDKFTPTIDGNPVSSIVAFGEDLDGELYLVAQGGPPSSGSIFKVIRDPAAPPATLCGPSADLNGDGQVDGGDLGVLLSAVGPCVEGAPCPADLDGSGIVDGGDIGLLLAAFD